MNNENLGRMWGQKPYSLKYNSWRKIQQDATIYQNLIPYLYEAQHVSGDTPPIIRSLKLHPQPLVFHTWKVIGRVVGGRCQAQYTADHQQTRTPNTHRWHTHAATNTVCIKVKFDAANELSNVSQSCFVVTTSRATVHGKTVETDTIHARPSDSLLGLDTL